MHASHECPRSHTSSTNALAHARTLHERMPYGERYQRPANLEEWCLGMESATSPKTELTALDDNLLLADAVIFGLRMNRGVDLKSLNLRFAHATNRIDLETKLKFFDKRALLKSKNTVYWYYLPYSLQRWYRCRFLLRSFPWLSRPALFGSILGTQYLTSI